MTSSQSSVETELPNLDNADLSNSNNIFDFKVDRWSCITIDTKKCDVTDVSCFREQLTESLLVWNERNVRGVWVKVWIEHSHVIPVCTNSGFVFHHAQADYVMLKKWLSKSESDNLPSYATHYLGCGGFVVNERDQVLVMQEKVGDQRWKLPGGHANPGEEVWEAAYREVKEETGIESEFVCVACFHHTRKYNYGCSDFYFVCLMRAKTENIQACPQEVAACRWMDFEEYLNHESVGAGNRYFAQRCIDILRGDSSGIMPHPLESNSSYGRVTNQVYHPDSTGLEQK